jgi:hypothetical protein
MVFPTRRNAMADTTILDRDAGTRPPPKVYHFDRRAKRLADAAEAAIPTIS